jgi:hypothetical protein
MAMSIFSGAVMLKIVLINRINLFVLHARGSLTFVQSSVFRMKETR